MSVEKENNNKLVEILKALKGIDIDKECKMVVNAGYEWADANAAAESLEEAKKSVLARLATKAMDESVKITKTGSKAISAIEADKRALADPEYQEHLNAMIEARKEANKKRVRYDISRVRLEMQRSIISLLKQEMSNF